MPEQLNICPKTKDIMPFVWNKIYKNSVIIENKILFDNKHRKWEDKEFVLWFLKYTNSMVCVDIALYHYESVDTSERLSTKFSHDLILSISERCRATFSLFDSDYNIRQSKYYRNYM